MLASMERSPTQSATVPWRQFRFPRENSLWAQPRNVRLGQGQLLLVGDVLVGQAESGEVVFVAANPSEYQELFRLPAMESKTWNIPTIAGRHLLVRNDRQAFCFLLPAQ